MASTHEKMVSEREYKIYEAAAANQLAPRLIGVEVSDAHPKSKSSLNAIRRF